MELAHSFLKVRSREVPTGWRIQTRRRDATQGNPSRRPLRLYLTPTYRLFIDMVKRKVVVEEDSSEGEERAPAPKKPVTAKVCVY